MKINATSLFFLSLPFTSVFSYNEHFSLSIIITIIILSSYLVKPLPIIPKAKRYIVSYYVFAAIFMVCITMISSASSANLDPVKYPHIIARLFFGFLLLGLILVALAASRYTTVQLKIMIWVSYFIVALICLIDWAQMSGYSEIVLPRVTVEELIINYGNSFRVRGPAEEPGYLASFFAATLPLLIQWSRRPYLVFAFVAFVVYILTFSFAFIIWMMVFAVILLFLNALRPTDNIVNKVPVVIRITTVVIVLLIVLYLFFDSDLIESKMHSYNDRLYSYELVQIFSDDPSRYFFGLGPGYFKMSGLVQPTNFLLSTLVELGLSGVLVFAALIFCNIYYLIQNRCNYLVAGAFAYLVFFIETPTYYYPFFSLPLFYILFIPGPISEISKHRR